MQVVAPQNTWIHQRRKRRQERQAAKSGDNMRTDVTDKVSTHTANQCSSDIVIASNEDGKDETDPPKEKRRRQEEECEDKPHETDSQVGSANSNSGENIPQKGTAEENKEQNQVIKGTENEQNLNISIEDIEEYVVKCTLTVRNVESNILLEMLWIDGESKELLHQLMQLFKNKLK